MALSDGELIQRTLAGDETAFGFLVDKYKGAVHALAYRKLGDFHLAEEIAQDTFLAAYQKLSTLRDYSRFPGWLYVIASRLCLMWRRKKRLPTHSIDKMESTEMESIAQRTYAEEQTQQEVRDALESLPESERTVLTLHYLAGMTCEEIGQFIGTSRGAILNRLYRARARLKEEMIPMMQKTLGVIQLPPAFTQQLVQQIRDLQPTPAPNGKPLVPWIAAATLAVIALLIGFGQQQMTRFQRPYSLDAPESATMVEIVDAPMIELPLAERSLVDRAASSSTGNAGNGDQNNDPVFASAADDQQKAKSSERGWAQTNGPYGGTVTALHATPEGTLFAGTQGAGIFRSVDSGDSWTAVNTGLSYDEGYGFVYVSVFAQKGETLYAGTGGGLYYSTDGGGSWQEITQFPRRSGISGVVVIGDTLYVGRFEDGVWCSDDDGESWAQINEGLTNLTIRELAVMGTTLFAGTGNGAFRRRANENSWTPINAGFTVQPINREVINKSMLHSGLNPLPMSKFPSGLRVDSFVVMDNTLYIGIYMGKDKGLFRSTNQGDSWTRITAASMKHTVEALAVSGTTLYASTFGGGVFRSMDAGDSWKEVNQGLTERTVSALLALSDKTVFVGTRGGGVFRSTDGGAAWTEANVGLTNTGVGDLVIIGETVYARTGENIVHSVDGGESWTPMKIGSTPMEYDIRALSVSGETLYVAAAHFPRDESGVFRWDNKTNLWKEIGTDRRLFKSQSLQIVGTTFYVSTQGDGVFRWEEGSDSWTNLGLEGHAVGALSVNGRTIYAGTWQGEIFRSTDAGKSWALINEAMTDNPISALKWVGTTLYAGIWGTGVFRSLDDGDSWISVSDGLTDMSVMTLIVDGATLYAGTYFRGVFRLEHGENEWESVGSMHRRISSLTVVDGVLYAGTAGEGVFRISLDR